MVATDLPASALADKGQPTRWSLQRVLSIYPWTSRLRSFRITRPPEFEFVPGHYGRMGLADASGETVWRPFSMVSAAADSHLEFLILLVPDGRFSGLFEMLNEGDGVLLDDRSFGFLTVSQLAPGKDLWMLASGSGLGPFVSILQDPPLWQSFDHIVLVHSVRQFDELAYRSEIAAIAETRAKEGSRASLRYIPVVTREARPGSLSARIPALISDARLQQAAGIALDVADSRVMVCGNPDLNRELRSLLAGRGFAPGRRQAPGQMVFEKYW